MAAIEFAVLSHQALDRFFADKAAVERWKVRQNVQPRSRNRQFKTIDVRAKPANFVRLFKPFQLLGAGPFFSQLFDKQ